MASAHPQREGQLLLAARRLDQRLPHIAIAKCDGRRSGRVSLELTIQHECRLEIACRRERLHKRGHGARVRKHRLALPARNVSI